MLFFVVALEVLPVPECFLARNAVVWFCGMNGPAVNKEVLNKDRDTLDSCLESA